MIGRIYVGYHQTLLHTKKTGFRSCGFRLGDYFTFSYCKSMGDDEPRGLANLDPRGMIGRIYVGYH